MYVDDMERTVPGGTVHSTGLPLWVERRTVASIGNIRGSLLNGPQHVEMLQ
jgi:hypothetical protein